MKMLRTLAITLPMVVLASGAVARGYSGNWPLTVTHSQRSNGSYCLTLTDNGAYQWKHSGQATIAGEPYGTFQIIEHTLTVTIDLQGGEGGNAGLVFTASERNGAFGTGITDTVYGGESIDSGVVAFGAKGGC